ncbi:MAG: iron-sulfur cluster assembly scaffold protein [Deltaproteobacteria bacterium]|nr:iron-sulfur cluster assembly scaffold protein [Deltaproteobacteria bacterium]MBW1923854.1 iron-sulfur cluster assembly scaffold protein [Deltaproteobacteria bacterium]MBW1949708.1 iron-sulfur cluster assembly scaffold protein [Deltaproteobacteria bacterium]MBW2008347.1 iron-sulfur cluster assembly scaffold protein [Deltaproteobacteria bacterium]MBW2102108.1 iron-sulfur cluster assembly scaffold protein [Deltaproteobacteria bacterium]
MASDLDALVRELQDRINEETRAVYGDVAFERWQNLIHRGAIDHPDGFARLTGTCGDTMEIYLKFKDEQVEQASFLTDGCGASAVCGSFAAEMAHGKTPDELVEITAETILQRLGGLPKEEEHCARLAAETLQEALNYYMTRQREKDSGGRDA